MLREGVGFKKVILVCGKTDLRKGSAGLAAVIQYHYRLNALEEGTLFYSVESTAASLRGCFSKATAIVLSALKGDKRYIVSSEGQAGKAKNRF